MNPIASFYFISLLILNVHFKLTHSCSNVTLKEPVPSGTIIQDFSTCMSSGKIGNCNANVELKLNCHDTENSENFPLAIINRTILRTTEELDREQRETYKLRCFYSPVSSEGESSTCHIFNFLLYINDTNDNGPMFTESSYSIEMFENNVNIRSIISDAPIITDRDIGKNAEYTLELLYANCSKQYVFILTTEENLVGIHFIQNIKVIDREFQDRYDLKLLAMDSQNNSMNSSASLTVYIKDQNDNPPIILNGSTVTIEISEDKEIGSKVGKILVSDQDIYPNNQTHFFISDSCLYTKKSEEFVLIIDQISGVLYLNKSIDAENGDERFTTQIVAIDATSSIYFSCIRLEIIVVDVNDNSPDILITPFVESVDENDGEIGEIVRVSVSDVDKGVNGEVNLNFSCEFSNCSCTLKNCIEYFELVEFVPTLYFLTLRKPLDFEKSDVVTITFTATDNGSTPTNTSKQFILNVNPINEYSPTFTRSSFTCTINEGLKVGVSFCEEIVATDLDNGDDGMIYYSFIRDTASPSYEEISEYFVLNVNGSTLQLLKNIDFEQLKSDEIFFFQLKASNPDAVKYSYTNVTIEIIDVNDNSPRFTNVKSSYTIQENVEVGTTISSLFGEDLDSGNNGEFVMSIQSDNSKFFIEPSTDGWVLKTNGNLDREVTSSYNLTILIVDKGIPSLTSQQHVTIHIEDINDNKPYFPKPMYEFQLFKINDAWTVEVEDADSQLIGQYRLDFRKHPELSSAIGFNKYVPSIIFQNPSAIQPGIYSFNIFVSDESISSEENSTTLVLDYEKDTTDITVLPNTTLRVILGSGLTVVLIIIISIVVVIILLTIYAVKHKTGINAYKLQVYRRNQHHPSTPSILKLNTRFHDSKNSKKVSFSSNVHLMTFSQPDGSTSENTSASSTDITSEENSKKSILQWPISSKHDAQKFSNSPRAEDTESWHQNALSNPIYDSQTHEQNAINTSDISHGHCNKDSNVPLISPKHEFYSVPHDTLIVNPHANYPNQYLPQNAYDQSQSSASYTNPMAQTDYGAAMYDPADIMPDILDSETTTDSEKPPHGAVPIYISSDMTSEGEFSTGIYSDNDTSISNQAQYCKTNFPSDSFDGDLTM